jgi:hypothetical protein
VIAVDTKVLVRLLIATIPASMTLRGRFSAAASAPCHRGSYRFTLGEVRATLLGVFESEQVVGERPGIMRAALSHTTADGADWPIHLLGQEAGCRSTVTFDRRFARHPGVELLG